MNDKHQFSEDPSIRDPITGAPGAHPVRTGAGAVVGGLAGKAAAEGIDPTVESAYWRENYATRTYVDKDASFEDYSPAYEYGVDSAAEFEEQNFEDVELDLSKNWDSARGASSLTWERARHATRDAWNRVRNVL